MKESAKFEIVLDVLKKASDERVRASFFEQ